MKNMTFRLTSEDLPDGMENEIREMIESYLLEKNIEGKCTLEENRFLAICNKRKKQGQISIRMDSILYMEKIGHKVTIYTVLGEFSYYTSLKKMEERLNPMKFVRIHQGYIVNVDEIDVINESELRISKCGRVLPISRRNRNKLYALLSTASPK